MSAQGIDNLLGELKAMSAKAAGHNSSAADALPEGADFASVLKSSLDQVNQMQLDSQVKQQAFETGDPNADLQDVMVSLQKASLSFQTMVQVRNKLVSAYQEVMNMQV
ncbi:flagellar hook-basal body complex protein FliE [Chitinimonas sp. BJB300]|uniref:flagellar hook-basal body complex protein FliE n=1 Tax=Chitinimonas sp. BJB300 TaxID=1559339 RepID=UPI000C0D2232|nr:flagellar hook-basal body complex protein FliE [Chitinimonas sp. BJB300]PHV13097.1 flagellar hook-basal body complex protein FliE [Chitinimonas sp. BJB300]TSJ84694.1 flagellar hook-basal body complex protein FliE [Chitinimonas sp. BJB300]